jgi:hypothetical protein
MNCMKVIRTARVENCIVMHSSMHRYYVKDMTFAVFDGKIHKTKEMWVKDKIFVKWNFQKFHCDFDLIILWLGFNDEPQKICNFIRLCSLLYSFVGFMSLIKFSSYANWVFIHDKECRQWHETFKIGKKKFLLERLKKKRENFCL